MFGDNIKRLREEKGLGINELSRISGVNASYISAMERGEKDNPTLSTLEKLAVVLGVTTSELMDAEPISEELLKEWDKQSNQVREEVTLYETGQFETPEAAMKFILNQKSIMGFGGFNVNKMSDEEVIEFANELLNQLKLISYKYKK